jgi:hypothetical protein
MATDTAGSPGAGATRKGRRAADLPIRRRRTDVRHELAALLGGPGPFLSVYLDATPGSARPTAAGRLQRELDLLDDLTDAQRARAFASLGELRDDDAMLVMVADAEGTGITAGYPQPPRRDVVELAPLPSLAPLLNAEQALAHHVIATVDNGTVDLITVPRHGETAHAFYDVDDTSMAAHLMHEACRASQTSLIAVCARAERLADLTARLQTELPLDTKVVAIASDGRSDERLASEIVRQIATHSAERTVELLRLWRFHLAHSEAVDGVVDTLAAIRERRIALVLVHDDPDDGRRAWFGEEATEVAIDLEDATTLSPDKPLLNARLTDVVLRAALLGDSPVHIVPSVPDTLSDGLGAILADRADPVALGDLLEH